MIRNLLGRIGGGWIFLILVGLIYVVVALLNLGVVEKAFFGFLQLVWRVIPVLGLVFGFIFLSNVVIREAGITRYLGRRSGLKGWIIAISAGILSAGPIYMWYPLLSDLKEKGMREGLVATFLYNRAVKIPLLPMMIYYFGLIFTVVLTVYMVLFSIITGLVFDWLGGDQR